ncbi:MAG: hypothetical protein AB1791_00010 [Chloroflexota bacterium]
MTKSRNLLLVEDSRFQYQALKAELETSGWTITRAEDEMSTLRILERTGPPIHAVALDLGLPPGKDNPLQTGLPLLQKLRECESALPILAYTGLAPTAFDHSLLVARLLPLRISFLYLRRMSNQIGLSTLLELVWQGFVFLSPGPADQLPQAVASKPDPLSDQHWQTLKLLAEDLGNKQIAREISDVGTEGVKARLGRIREILVGRGELERHQTAREDLVAWYRRHRVRYCRD